MSSWVLCHPQQCRSLCRGQSSLGHSHGKQILLQFACLQVIPEASFWQQAPHRVLSLSPQAPEDLGLGASVSSGLCPHDQRSVLHVLPTRRIHCNRVSKQQKRAEKHGAAPSSCSSANSGLPWGHLMAFLGWGWFSWTVCLQQAWEYLGGQLEFLVSLCPVLRVVWIPLQDQGWPRPVLDGAEGPLIAQALVPQSPAHLPHDLPGAGAAHSQEAEGIPHLPDFLRQQGEQRHGGEPRGSARAGGAAGTPSCEPGALLLPRFWGCGGLFSVS